MIFFGVCICQYHDECCQKFKPDSFFFQVSEVIDNEQILKVWPYINMNSNFIIIIIMITNHHHHHQIPMYFTVSWTEERLVIDQV